MIKKLTLYIQNVRIKFEWDDEKNRKIDYYSLCFVNVLKVESCE